jgi:hypothetical protein
VPSRLMLQLARCASCRVASYELKPSMYVKSAQDLDPLTWTSLHLAEQGFTCTSKTGVTAALKKVQKTDGRERRRRRRRQQYQQQQQVKHCT